jgi:hypothetical protein
MNERKNGENKIVDFSRGSRVASSELFVWFKDVVE